MKIVQVTPSHDAAGSLKSMLKSKERELRGKGTTLRRTKEGRWTHAKYSGWINWEQTLGGLLVAEVNTKKPESEWQLLQAFIGYLDRHFGDSIEAITISYR